MLILLFVLSQVSLVILLHLMSEEGTCRPLRFLVLKSLGSSISCQSCCFREGPFLFLIRGIHGNLEEFGLATTLLFGLLEIFQLTLEAINLCLGERTENRLIARFGRCDARSCILVAGLLAGLLGEQSFELLGRGGTLGGRFDAAVIVGGVSAVVIVEVLVLTGSNAVIADLRF